MDAEAALVGELRGQRVGGHGGNSEIWRVVASFFGPTDGGRWLWCSEDGGSGLAWLSVEETKETEKTRADGFGSFSGAEHFIIFEEYSLFQNLSAP
jgi:hypothetical protein